MAAGNYFQRLSQAAGAAWNQFWFTPVSPVPLARLRIAVGIIAMLYFLSWTTHVGRMFGPGGLLPADMVLDLEQQRLLDRPHFHLSPLFHIASNSGLLAFSVAAVVAAALFTAGVLTRFSGAITLVMVLSFVHRAPMLTGPLETVLVMLLLYLTIGPAGAALSFDAWWAQRAEKPLDAPSWTANLALRLIQVHVSALVWLIACSMLASGAWWNGTAIWTLEAQALSRPIDLSILRSFPKLINGWTHLFVLVNLLFPILVWNRLLRPLVLSLAIVFWILMIPVSGQVLYVAALVTAMCAFVSAVDVEAERSVEAEGA